MYRAVNAKVRVNSFIKQSVLHTDIYLIKYASLRKYRHQPIFHFALNPTEGIIIQICIAKHNPKSVRLENTSNHTWKNDDTKFLFC